MGGSGSGRRWHYGAKGTVEDHRRLDIRRLQQEKVFFEGNTFSWAWYRREEKVASIWISVKSDQVFLDYRFRSSDGEWHPVKYPVFLRWSDCHLGGSRPWFICPGRGCHRRVAILYSGNYFLCRHCHKLAYSSQREVQYDRLARRADKIRERLGWEPGILNGPGWRKPKGMHWKTFERLTAEHDRLVQASINGMAVKMRLLGESIGDWI
jgi:hypothetical protein